MEPAMEAPLALIFEDVVFTIITTAAISHEDQEKLLDTLIENGATYRATDSDTGRVRNLSDLTHIISTTCDFPEYDTAIDEFKEVVTPQWIRDSEAKNKKCNPRQYSPDPRMFMSGVNVYCADIPEGDKNAIAGGVIAMGGLYSGPLTKLVTHVVALTMDNDAVQVVQDKNLPCKIVLPHWFDDCLRLGRRLKEDPYELPDAAILKIGKLPPHSTSFSAIDGALTPTPSSLSIQSGPDDAPRELSVFKGMSLFLSEDLGLGSHLLNTLADLIKTGHGSLVDKVEEAEMVVCQYRDGKDYITASLNGLHVGNLAWLYHMIARDAWVSPVRRLLHYPVPRKGIEGFEHFTISLSNYQGAARVYIENLVKAAGAKYTKTMKNDNTHLIAAHSSGEKFTAASDWSIAVVNHLWLEDSYAKCKPQALTNPKYTHFPNRANLTDCVGQTEIDRDAIKAYFVTKTKRRSKEPHGPLPTPATSSGVPGSSVAPLAATKNGENVKEPAPDPMDGVTEDPPAPQTAKARRVSKEVKSATPASKGSDKGKENDTPPTTGRAAKMKATNKLHDLAPDITKFQSEMKRKGGVIHGGRRSTGDSTDERPKSAGSDAPKDRKKRTSDRMREVTPSEADTDNDPESPPAKKTRKGKRTSTGLPAIIHRLLLTGDTRWKDSNKQHSADKEKLRALGIIETESPKEVTIVVVPRMLRTFKFVASIANGPLIVHTDWLDYTLKNKRMPDDNTPYLLNDEACEEQYGFELAPALERAKKNKKHLLRDWQIFVTEQVKGGPDTYINIVAANGGKCSKYVGRQGVTARKRAVNNHADDIVSGDDTASEQEPEDEEDIVYLVSGTSAAEKKIWPKFREMAKKENMTARIASIDWILHVCMAQTIKWDPEWELK